MNEHILLDNEMQHLCNYDFLANSLVEAATPFVPARSFCLHQFLEHRVIQVYNNVKKKSYIKSFLSDL